MISPMITEKIDASTTAPAVVSFAILAWGEYSPSVDVSTDFSIAVFAISRDRTVDEMRGIASHSSSDILKKIQKNHCQEYYNLKSKIPLSFYCISKSLKSMFECISEFLHILKSNYILKMFGLSPYSEFFPVWRVHLLCQFFN